MSETNHEGAKWLKENLAYRQSGGGFPQVVPSAFGLLVANILGQVYRGLYHIEDSAVFHKRTKWNDERWIEIVIRGGGGELATVDGCDLTFLVLLCHEAAVRLSISGCAPGLVRLTFSKRQRTGNFAQRHWTIQRAIEALEPYSLKANGLLPEIVETPQA